MSKEQMKLNKATKTKKDEVKLVDYEQLNEHSLLKTCEPMINGVQRKVHELEEGLKQNRVRRLAPDKHMGLLDPP